LKTQTSVGPVSGINKSRSKVAIFDTTLRDGEQSPGATLYHKEKIQIAKQLEKLNVDVIEAGFPAASKGDFKAVREIAETIKKPIICALARTLTKDLEIALDAVQDAKKPRIHTFIATSPIHLKHKLKMSRAEVKKQTFEMVKYARSLCRDIEFSAEDATRTEPKFLFKIFEAAIDAGASTINIPDTVGYSQPQEFGKLVKAVKENVPNISNAKISVHCHNDLGLAVANSLAAANNGAGQIECTINGLGERAGNASLEEIAMNLFTRKQFFESGTRLNLKEIYPASQMVSKLTGISVQRNKAVVGENAFAHEAGIHQHGILADSRTYEIMNPNLIGKETSLVLGKHSGKHATKEVLKKMGFSFSDEQLQAVSARIKLIADRKKSVKNKEIIAIAKEINNSNNEVKK